MTTGTYMTRFSEAQDDLNKFLNTEVGHWSEVAR